MWGGVGWLLQALLGQGGGRTLPLLDTGQAQLRGVGTAASGLWWAREGGEPTLRPAGLSL